MKVKYQISRKCGHSFLITDNRHPTLQLRQDQGVLSGCIRQSPSSDSDIQCRIHVKLSSDIFVTMAAIFTSKMGKQEPQTLVGESWARFVELWTCGKSATFHVECWNGEARLHFFTLLGSPGDSSNRTESARSTFFPTTKVKSQKNYSPSKLKRNQLRLQTFLEKKRQESYNEKTESVKGDEKTSQEPCSDEDVCPSHIPETKSQEPCSHLVDTKLADSQFADQSTSNEHLDLKSPHFQPPFNSTPSKDVSQSPFSGVETLLQRIDSQSPLYMSYVRNSREGLIKCDEDVALEEPSDLRAKAIKLGRRNHKLIGLYVEKEIFDSIDDPFVYEIYLEVLAAQAEFEAIFGRPWDSVEHIYIDLENYLFVPYVTIENVREYLRRRKHTSSFNNFEPRVHTQA